MLSPVFRLHVGAARFTVSRRMSVSVEYFIAARIATVARLLDQPLFRLRGRHARCFVLVHAPTLHHERHATQQGHVPRDVTWYRDEVGQHPRLQ